MDDVARRRSVLLTARARGAALALGSAAAIAAVGAVVACAPGDVMLGKSAPPAPLSEGRVVDAAVPPPPTTGEQWRASLKRIDEGEAPFPSRGHAGGRWTAYAFANDTAIGALDAGRGDYPVGSLFVEQHFEARRPDAGGPEMRMEKLAPGFDPDGGDWRYAVVNGAGAVVSDGRIAACAECHGAAPRDHVFAVEPRAPDREPRGTR